MQPCKPLAAVYVIYLTNAWPIYSLPRALRTPCRPIFGLVRRVTRRKGSKTSQSPIYCTSRRSLLALAPARAPFYRASTGRAMIKKPWYHDSTSRSAVTNSDR